MRRPQSRLASAGHAQPWLSPSRRRPPPGPVGAAAGWLSVTAQLLTLSSCLSLRVGREGASGAQAEGQGRPQNKQAAEGPLLAASESSACSVGEKDRACP